VPSAAGTSNHLGGVRIDHITQGIAGHQGANGDAVQSDRGAANAAAHGACQAKQFANQGTSASADIALRRSLAAGGLAGQVAGLRVGPDAGVSHRQVKQHGGWHDGHQAKAHVQANALFLQPAHHARCGVQPPGAAAGQQYGVRPVH